jgi:hypothetical protein
MMTLRDCSTCYLFYAPNQLTEQSLLDTSGQNILTCFKDKKDSAALAASQFEVC